MAYCSVGIKNLCLAAVADYVHAGFPQGFGNEEVGSTQIVERDLGEIWGLHFDPA